MGKDSINLEEENKRLLRRYAKMYYRLVEQDSNEELEFEELEDEILQRMNNDTKL